MVFVIVVMACCANCKSAIFRLCLAIMMLRVLGRMPNPFSNSCEKPTNSDDCTEGLNRFDGELEELRVLFQVVKKVVPVWNPCEYCVLYCAVCVVMLASVVVPVPEMNGL